MRHRKITMVLLAILIIAIENIHAQSAMLPTLVEKDGRHALLVDGKPFLILGGQAHNSSAWPGMMPQVWQAVKTMHANTLEVPIYWEQVEPAPGKFNFSLVDTLLIQARKQQVKLILLWFATWKNGSNHYMPEWMKLNSQKYPNITGKTGKPVDSPSPNTEVTMEADKKAFTMVMRYLKKADTQHTVIMVQVENESGAWGSVRDYSPMAQKLFEGQVPQALLQAGVLAALHVPVVSQGSWQEVFGERADEYFHAWSVAHFIGQVAAAGKAEYPLPMYANASLRDPLTNPSATSYESGGPTDNVIPIWKVAAPAIDIVSPDIYLSGCEKVLKVLELYNRPDNALLVPEAATSAENAKYLYEVIARGGIGFSPFGIDANGHKETDAESVERLAPFGQEYAMATPMMRELAKWAFEGKIKSVVEHEDHAEQKIDLGAWQVIVSFGTGRRSNGPASTKSIGKMMIVQLGADEFILIGTNCHTSFEPAGSNAGKAWQYNKVEEGSYSNGTFKPLRILNGDETDWGGPRFDSLPIVLRTSLIVR